MHPTHKQVHNHCSEGPCAGADDPWSMRAGGESSVNATSGNVVWGQCSSPSWLSAQRTECFSRKPSRDCGSKLADSAQQLSKIIPMCLALVLTFCNFEMDIQAGNMMISDRLTSPGMVARRRDAPPALFLTRRVLRPGAPRDPRRKNACAEASGQPGIAHAPAMS